MLDRPFALVESGTCEIHLKGLKRGQIHAIHIHEFGDLTQGCKSCGGHFNPGNCDHTSGANVAITV